MSDLPTKLKRLNSAVQELTTAKSEQELFERILDVIQRGFQRQTCAVLLKDDAGRLRIVASRGYDPEVVSSYSAGPGEGVAGKVAQSGRGRLVEDVTREPGYVPGVNAAISEMAVPLTVDGEVIGVLDVEGRERALIDEDMALLEAFGEQAAWAMRHGRVQTEAAERARRLELLNRAARAINTIHDVDALLERILELANQALGFHNVAILVADSDGRHLEVRKALRPHRVEGLRIPVDQGITGEVYSSGKPEIVADVTADPRYIPGGMDGPLLARGPRTEMVAPLNLDGEVIGVLDAETEGVGSFDPLDLELFTSFAAQVATALRNAQLLQQLEDRANRLNQITRTGRALNTIHDADQLLERILEAASSAMGLDRTALLLYYKDSSTLMVHATRGYREEVLGTSIGLGEGVTGHVAMTGEPALVNDVTADERYLPGAEARGSEMAVPLRVYGELFGVLDTESPDPDAFTVCDLELFQAFADQAAVALHNARLFRRLERANQRLTHNVEEMGRLNKELETYAQQIAEANQNLAMQIRQLTTLHQAGRAITSSLDLSHTLDAILSMSAEIVESSSGAIKLIDDETKELKIAAQAGILQDNGRQLRYDLPLKIGERTIGVFEVVREATVQLGEGDQQLLETLAAQAAIAIENARLFEDTQRVYYETLKSLAKALEARDDYTRGHSERVANLSLAIAHELQMSDEQCHLIYNSALLHDIGKIGVRDSILLKPRKLTDEEFEIIRRHPAFGNAILGPLKFLGQVAELVKHHHERWDGSGYPSGLVGEQIPLPSRIISVADAYDAMTSSRPYREAMSHEQAIEEITRESGQQLDSRVVDAFFKVIARRSDKAAS